VSSYSASQGNCVEVGVWRMSTYSAGQGNCVEVGTVAVGPRGAVVAVRDTKDRSGAVLRVSAETWRRFAATLR
jgi:hypothetical protein